MPIEKLRNESGEDNSVAGCPSAQVRNPKSEIRMNSEGFTACFNRRVVKPSPTEEARTVPIGLNDKSRLWPEKWQNDGWQNHKNLNDSATDDSADLCLTGNPIGTVRTSGFGFHSDFGFRI